MQAYYIARSGVVAVAEYMIQLGEIPDGFVGNTSAANNQIGGGEFTISITEDENKKIIVTADSLFKGVKGVAKLRLIDRKLSGSVGGIFNYPLAAKKTINENSNNVNGINIEMEIPTVAIADENGIIDLGKNTEHVIQVKNSDLEFKEVEIKDEYESYSNIVGAESLLVNSGDIRYIKTNKVDLNNGNLTVTGGGTIHLYVIDSINLRNATINVEGTSRLYLYYDGVSEIIFQGKNTINNFVLYVPNSIVKWDSANTSHIFGAVYASEIYVHNNLTFKYIPELMEGINFDPTFAGVEYEGYTWLD